MSDESPGKVWSSTVLNNSGELRPLTPKLLWNAARSGDPEMPEWEDTEGRLRWNLKVADSQIKRQEEMHSAFVTWAHKLIKDLEKKLARKRMKHQNTEMTLRAERANFKAYVMAVVQQRNAQQEIKESVSEAYERGWDEAMRHYKIKVQ